MVMVTVYDNGRMVNQERFYTIEDAMSTIESYTMAGYMVEYDYDYSYELVA